MRHVCVLLALFFSLSVVVPQSHAASPQHITVAQLQQMFANMRAAAKWNIDGPLLWGYYFTDPDPQKLDLLAKHLAQTGYRVVGVYQADDKSTYFLHVERVEHLTVNTLNQRNQEFYNLAEQYNVASYDGMDVGPLQ